MTPNKRLQVLVVGAGVAGLTTAYWLHRAGHDARVIERARRPREQGFMIDFYGPGYAVAEEMGMIRDLERVHRDVARWTVRDASGYPLFSFRYADARERLFAGRHFNFLRSDLERLLLGRIEGEVEVRRGVTLELLRPCGSFVAASLSDGSTLVCDVVVGAGGVHSMTRRLWIDGADSCERYLGFDAAAFSIDDANLAAAVGEEVRTLSSPGRQVTVYPTTGDRLGVLFVHERARTLEDRSTSAVVEELRSRFGGFGGVVPLMLSEVERANDLYYDGVTQVRLPRWNRGRVVLVGDACGCVSPVGGQGASLAMAGARMLVRELVASGGDVESGLASYEQNMRPVVTRAQETGRRLARWIAPHNKLKLAVRDLALRAALWPVASTMVRRALAASEQVH